MNPRRRTLLRLRAPSLREGRVQNLSLDGLFLAGADLGRERFAELSLPGREAPIPLALQHTWGRAGGTAVQFALENAADRRAVSAHIHYQREQERVQAMEARFGALARNLKPVAEHVGLREVLRLARSTPLEIFHDPEHEPAHARMVQLDSAQGRLRLELLEAAPLAAFREVVVVVPGGSFFWLADTFVDRLEGQRLDLLVPERLFVPERRVAERDGVRGTLVVDGLPPLRVLDAGPDGLRLQAPAELEALLDRWEGAAEAELHTDRGAQAIGPVQRAWMRREGEEIRLGLSRTTARRVIPVRQLDCRFPAPSRLQKWMSALDFGVHSLLDRIGAAPATGAAEVWPLTDAHGRTLVSLVDQNFSGAPTGTLHVVLIPPAYGRRKEHPGALAGVITASFTAARQQVVVVRWDGINHLGESTNDAPPDHAMLQYTQSQSVADLDLVCRSVATRFPGARRTAVITFSLAAVATRAYLARGGAGIDLWIAPMGAADARDTIRNGSGGFDLVGERQKGTELGFQLLQGHLVDADHHCDDLIQGGFADLADARRDMARVTQPVIWMVGTHDYWVNRRRVEDVMSVPAAGSRELIEVPTGHQLRASEEALATFRLIAERLLSDLARTPGPGVIPTGWQLAKTEAKERARLKEKPFDAAAYWRDYLVGRDGNPFGFDLLTLTDEYQDLVEAQLRLLSPAPGARVADLGCGTGNLVVGLLESAAGGTLQIDAVDFVPEALDRVWEKVQTHTARGGVATVRLHQADLRLVDSPNLPFADGALDAVMLSLVLPYLPEPERLLREVFRVLRPGGVLVASTLRPDADMSGAVERLRVKIERGDTRIVEGWTAPQLLLALRAYLNDAVALLDGEVQGRFRFFADRELTMLLSRTGFRVEAVEDSFGVPPMAVIARGRRPGG